MPLRRQDSSYETFPGIRLRILGSDRYGIAAEQVGLFLFDFTVAFELFRRVVEERGPARLTGWDLYRGHRRVAPVERLAVERIRMESPLEVIATTITMTGLGIGAVWASIQAFERIYMLPLNRKKTELEIRKLEHEVRRLKSDTLSAKQVARLARPDAERARKSLARIDEADATSTIPSSLPRRTILNSLVRRPDDEYRSRRQYDGESRRVIETVQRRLLRNPIQIEQLDFEFDPQLPPPAG